MIVTLRTSRSLKTSEKGVRLIVTLITGSKSNMPQRPDYTGVTIVELSPDSALGKFWKRSQIFEVDGTNIRVCIN